VPVQLEKVYPVLGVAVNVIEAPEMKFPTAQPTELAGDAETEPLPV
jgi:hypothetical protein